MQIYFSFKNFSTEVSIINPYLLSTLTKAIYVEIYNLFNSLSHLFERHYELIIVPLRLLTVTLNGH